MVKIQKSFLLALLLSFTLYGVSIAQNLEFIDSISLTAGIPFDIPSNPSVAYNSKRDEYLVVYDYSNIVLAPNTQIHGALLSSKGRYIKNIIISDMTNSCINPQAGYDSVKDRYFITWLYDDQGDASNWDLFGRFIATDGSYSGEQSFYISQDPRWTEYAQRMAFNSDIGAFVVVFNSLDGDAVFPSRISGFRIYSSSPLGRSKLFDIIDASKNLINPDVAYNPHDKEIIIAYSDVSHIYVRRMTNLASFPSAARNITNISPPLNGTHDNPSVAYLQDHGAYLVVWNTDRTGGSGKIYVGLFGAADFANSTLYTFKIDGDDSNARPDFYPDISCPVEGNDCLTTWTTVNNNTYFTFGRLLRFGSTPFLQPAFPFNNLGGTGGWGTRLPRVSVGSGKRNFLLGYGGIPADGIMRMYARPTNVKFALVPYILLLKK